MYRIVPTACLCEIDTHFLCWLQVLWSQGSKRALAQQLFQLAAASRNMRVCEARVPMPFHSKREVQTFEETSGQSTLCSFKKQQWDCGKAPKMPFPLPQVLTRHGHFCHHRLAWCGRLVYDKSLIEHCDTSVYSHEWSFRIEFGVRMKAAFSNY